MFTNLGRRVLETPQTQVWSVMLGLARTVLALATGLTLLFTNPYTLLQSNSSLVDRSLCTGIDAANLFCLVPLDKIPVAYGLALAVLALVASGWRPRLTGLLHWWVAWSYHQAGTFVDGGDQVAMILALLLIPVTLTDPRVWHWQRAASDAYDLERPFARLVALGWLALIRLQVAVIYFHAAVAKFSVPEWLNGTAVYYWFDSATLGMPAWLHPILDPLLNSSVAVLTITWGTMLLEIVLALGLLCESRYRRPLLVLGLMFHAGIAVVFSLSSFMLAMDAALLLYLGDPHWKLELATLPRRLPKPVRVIIVKDDRVIV